MFSNRFKSLQKLAAIGCAYAALLSCMLHTSEINAQADCSFTCIDQVNLSLSEECTAVVSIASLLSKQDKCTESDFSLVLKDEHGIPLSSNEVDISYIDQNLEYHVQNSNGISCWGHVLIEYKFIPQITCQDTLYLSCGSLDILPLPEVPATGSGSCIPRTFNVYLANEVRDQLDCDPEFTFEVTRTYAVSDGNEVLNSCEQKIFLRRPDLDNIQFPGGSVTISCSDTDTYIFENGVPIPWISSTPTGSGSYGIPYGVPIICEADSNPTYTGLVCPLTGSGTGIPLVPRCASLIDENGDLNKINGSTLTFCNTAVDYEDDIVEIDGCTKLIYRTWSVREWWCSGEYEEGPAPQLIKVIDDEPPLFECPNDFTVSTNDECEIMATIPKVNPTDDCGNGISVRVEFQTGSVDSSGGPALLVAGKDTLLKYIVSDNCYNSTTCEVEVTLRDNTEPVAICERTTVISISQDGNTVIYAGTFDDGSWDECSIDRFEVSRMSANGLNFGPYVNFSCVDVGKEIMVVFRVYDHGGNFSDCMVAVAIQDLSTPTLSCPKDFKVDCDFVFDPNQLGDSFDNPVVTDNCASVYTPIELQPISSLNQCGVGTIIRNFEIVTTTNQVVTCKQTIEFEGNIYDENDIVWPSNETFTDMQICSPNQLLPANLDAPINYPAFPGQDEACSLLGYDFVDKVTGEGACFKIDRKWTVIDWCNQIGGSFAIYEMPGVQTLTVNSTETPKVVFENNPEIFNSTDIDCLNGDIDITVSAMTDCTEGVSLEYMVHRVSDGSFVTSGTGNNLKGTFAAGDYRISWTLDNGCTGGSVTEVQDLSVINSKLPIPICMNNMEVNLVAGSGTLTPTQINWKSYSPCGNDIEFSFDENNSLFEWDLVCSDLTVDPLLVPLYVHDVLSGMNSLCFASIILLDDPNAPCSPTGQNVDISGDIYTEDYQSIEAVEVSMDDNMPMEMTNQEGEFAFLDMPMGGSYEVKPHKNNDHLNGISTLDVILIQRHILGLEQFDSPYKLIAADVNDSQDVNGLDLVELRKLILGVYSEFPNNTSWRFVDSEYDFVDATNPWSDAFNESYLIAQLESDMKIDFVGVKVGDVNGSAVTSQLNKPFNNRDQRWPLEFNTLSDIESNGQIKVAKIAVANYENISGWQGTIQYTGQGIQILEVSSPSVDWREDNYIINSTATSIAFSYSSNKPVTLENGTVLLEIYYLTDEALPQKEAFIINSSLVEAEAYRGVSDRVPLIMTTKRTIVNNEIHASPNPWVEQTTVYVSVSKSGEGTLEMFDTQGKLIYSSSQHFDKGEQSVIVNSQQMPVDGVIYMRLQQGDQITESKMLKLQ